MMETPSWFEESWINTDAKALGLYIALLYSIFEAVRFNLSKDSTINKVKVEIKRKLTGKDTLEAPNLQKHFWKSL
jgi:hypothetical protein